MSRNKELTICMGVYNGEQWLDESIGSVLGQTYGDFEFLILEDCSTDGSLEKLRSFKDKRIKLLPQKENVGFSHIKMYEEIKTKYVTFIDQDDRFIRNDTFSHLLELTKSNDYDFVNFIPTKFLYSDGSSDVCRATMYNDFSYCGDKLFEKFFPCDGDRGFSAKIIKNEIFQKSVPYNLYGKRFVFGDAFIVPMVFFLSKRYLHVTNEEPMYEYKYSTGFWGTKRNDVSPQRIGDLCVAYYNCLVSLYNRMIEIRPMTNVELNNLINGVNIPTICYTIANVRKKLGDEYADGLVKIFHSAFCADGIHLLNGIEQFAFPSYVQHLESIMK